MLSTNLTQRTAVHMGDLSSAISLSNARAQGMLAGLSDRMAAMGVTDPGGAARKAFSGLLSQNAQVLAFGDDFALLTTICLVAAVVSLPGPTRADGHDGRRAGARGESLMPRLAGQVDRAKAEAMLVAAGQVISERGFGAPVEAIAKRAGVSKQTLYNHYGGKAGLIRALIRRRVDAMTAPLVNESGPRPEAALTAFAHGLLENNLSPTTIALTRAVIQGAADMPDIAQAMHEAGGMVTRARLVQFLEAETKAGRLAVEDPWEAAEFFTGMVNARQMRGLLGLAVEGDPATIDRLSASIAHRFVAAYAPKLG